MTWQPSSSQPSSEPQARPSWSFPVAVGAILAFVLHLPALQENVLWFQCCCGCTGIPAGIVPVLMVLRHDSHLGAQSGFSVGFLSIGIGMVALAAITVLTGFEISVEAEREMRAAWIDGGADAAGVDEMVETARYIGPFLSVVAAGCTALTAGLTGAVVASWADRRRRRRQTRDPMAFPPGAQP